MCAGRKRRRFDHLLVDEYQDTNGSQYRIVRALGRGHRNLCVVGDDDQSIYGWRGAEVEHILRFARDWPDAKVVRLEDNYRSTTAIIEHANRLIAFNKTRHDKVLRAARPGGEKPRILQCKDENGRSQGGGRRDPPPTAQTGVEPGDIAILFRTNEQPRAFEAELRRVKMPYVLIGGMSFFDRKEVRDILAYLKLLVMPRDETSLLRIINTPPRGIGSRHGRDADGRGRRTGLAACGMSRRGRSCLLRCPPKALPPCDNWSTSLETIPQHRVKAANDVVGAMWLRESASMRSATKRSCGASTMIRTNSSRAGTASRKWSTHWPPSKPRLTGRHWSDFLDDVALAGREFDNDKEDQLRRNAVSLMTLHCAKGWSFPQVYMVGMEEGILPHHRSVDEDGQAIDEERRLCYVGITRAQESLTFSLALTRRKWGKPVRRWPADFCMNSPVKPTGHRICDLASPKRSRSRHPRPAGAAPPAPDDLRTDPPGRPMLTGRRTFYAARPADRVGGVSRQLRACPP